MASGALESIVINGRRFTCKSDDDVEILLPGFTNETITHGDGSVSFKKIRHTGRITGVTLLVDDARDDQEFLKEVQDGLEPVSVNCTKVDGTFYAGTMQITEEIPETTGENAISISLEGQLEKLG